MEGISKSFGATRALAGVDMSVPAGTVQGLLGPNGAGKTTLVRVLATLLAPDAGRARISGVDVQQDPNAWKVAADERSAPRPGTGFHSGWSLPAAARPAEPGDGGWTQPRFSRKRLPRATARRSG